MRDRFYTRMDREDPSKKDRHNKKQKFNSLTHRRRYKHELEEQNSPDPVRQILSDLGNQKVGELLEFGMAQAKLRKEGDKDALELEADLIANTVVQSDNPGIQVLQILASRHAAYLKNKQTKLDQAIQNKIENLSGGQELESKVKKDMENRLGADLSGIRIHNDTNAHKMADSIHARAFTFRNHIVFGKGEYSPATHTGKLLLAHEIVHTIQQGAVKQFLPLEKKISFPDIKTIKQEEAPPSKPVQDPKLQEALDSLESRVKYYMETGKNPYLEAMKQQQTGNDPQPEQKTESIQEILRSRWDGILPHARNDHDNSINRLSSTNPKRFDNSLVYGQKSDKINTLSGRGLANNPNAYRFPQNTPPTLSTGGVVQMKEKDGENNHDKQFQITPVKQPLIKSALNKDIHFGIEKLGLAGSFYMNLKWKLYDSANNLLGEYNTLFTGLDIPLEVIKKGVAGGETKPWTLICEIDKTLAFWDLQSDTYFPHDSIQITAYENWNQYEKETSKHQTNKSGWEKDDYLTLVKNMVKAYAVSQLDLNRQALKKIKSDYFGDYNLTRKDSKWDHFKQLILQDKQLAVIQNHLKAEMNRANGRFTQWAIFGPISRHYTEDDDYALKSAKMYEKRLMEVIQARKEVRKLYPELNLVNVEEIDESTTNVSIHGKMNESFQKTEQALNDAKKGVLNGDIPLTKLGLLTGHINHYINKTVKNGEERKQLESTINGWIESEEKKEMAINVGGTVIAAGLGIAAMFATGGAAVVLGLIGAGVGLGTAGYDLEMAQDLYTVSNAEVIPETLVNNKEEINFNYAMAILNVFLAGFDMGMALKGAGEMLYLSRMADKEFLQFSRALVGKMKVEDTTQFLKAVQIRELKSAQEADEIIALLRKKYGKETVDNLWNMSKESSILVKLVKNETLGYAVSKVKLTQLRDKFKNVKDKKQMLLMFEQMKKSPHERGMLEAHNQMILDEMKNKRAYMVLRDSNPEAYNIMKYAENLDEYMSKTMDIKSKTISFDDYEWYVKNGMENKIKKESLGLSAFHPPNFPGPRGEKTRKVLQNMSAHDFPEEMIKKRGINDLERLLAKMDMNERYSMYVKHIEEGAVLNKGTLRVGTAEEDYVIKGVSGIYKDKKGFFADYDIHGCYLENGQMMSKDKLESMYKKLNNKFGFDMFNHGSQDEWGDGRHLLGISPPVTVYTPEGLVINISSKEELIVFYENVLKKNLMGMYRER